MNSQQMYYYATRLLNFKDEGMLLPLISESEIEIYPHQIASAIFGLKRFNEFEILNVNKTKTGVLLCDEGGLGKTYTAVMIAATRYNMGDKILIIVPNSLKYQWIQVFENHFNIDIELIGNDNYEILEDNKVFLTTYAFASKNKEYLKQFKFDIVVFDEAHKLCSGFKVSKLYERMVDLTQGVFKILLTATPIQNSILDIYYLLKLIDDNIFGDSQSFYKKYYRKEENYGELANKIRSMAFRTLREQVREYINIPNRISMSIKYDFDDNEIKLYKLLESYLNIENKDAFPKMEKYELSLMFTKALSSSNKAFEKMLKGVRSRISNEMVDSDYVDEMIKLSQKIKNPSKTEHLEIIIKEVFKTFKKKKIDEKIIIFTEYRETLKYLYELLNKGTFKGKVLTYDSSNSEENIKEKFLGNYKILITTDLASDGLNFSFASAVINFDLPYNILKIEQRTNRIHRLGQCGESLVINFFNYNNFYDVRILELIKKRILQFNSIMGSSDNFIGEFVTLDECIKTLEEIKSYNHVKQDYEITKNNFKTDDMAKLSEHFLYTSFSKSVRDSVFITPNIVKNETEYLKQNLWEFVKTFFSNKPNFIIDEETQSIVKKIGAKSPFVSVAMQGDEYSILDDSISKACKINIDSKFVKNIATTILWNGAYTVSEAIQNINFDKIRIGYFKIVVKSKGDLFFGKTYYRFVGKFEDIIISHRECEKVFENNFKTFVDSGKIVGDKNRHLNVFKSDLEQFLEDDINKITYKYLRDTEGEVGLTIDKERDFVELKKESIERDINLTYKGIKKIEEDKKNASTKIELLRMNKQKNILLRDIKAREENVFLEKLKIDIEFEKFTDELKSFEDITVEVVPLFEVVVRALSKPRNF